MCMFYYKHLTIVLYPAALVMPLSFGDFTPDKISYKNNVN